MQEECENVAPSQDQSASSPLKDVTSSPNFRAVDEDGQTIELKRTIPISGGRKSLGRRVSFAATAHVRLYDKDEDEDDGTTSEKEHREQKEQNDEFRPMNKKMMKGSPAPPSPRSPRAHVPSRLSETHSPSISRSPSLHRSSSTIQCPGSPSSVAGSFDMDLKDANSSSFTSYLEEDDDNETIELSQIKDTIDEGVDMEFTSCVGGILTKESPTDAKTEDNTMDFTVCVGGIIRRLPQPTDASPASSVDTMELTECVGKIIARQQGISSPLVRRNDDMEMTMVMNNPIVCPESPSPFLVQPKTEPSTVINSTAMTFIEDIGEPDAFQLLGCVSPMPKNNPTCEQDHSLFNTFIDTEKCEDPTVNRAGGLVYSSLAGSIESLRVHMPLHTSMSLLNTPLPPYSTTTSSIPASSPAHQIVSLPEFLNETGIRFLENISSLKRRETTGRPRDSDIVAPSKQAFIASALVPQLDFYESVYLLGLSFLYNRV